jgi:hypothetical protein
MDLMSDQRPPFFVLGAGFGVDASAIVGPIEAESIYIGRYRLSCNYPLVRDLPGICFPNATPTVPVAEIEKQLGEALAAGDYLPIERLCDWLATADHYLAPPLVGWPKDSNVYAQFFAKFPASSFASYNYDAFVEFALFRAGRWFPHDGYGVKVAVNLGLTAEPYQMRDSECLVLHLHGTYMVYSYAHTFGAPDKHGVAWMKLFESPRFGFDPYALGAGFYPFERFMAGLAYHPDVQDRIVAPIPGKATGLKADFVRQVTQRAKEMIAKHGHLVAIGYAFAAHDSASCSQLLETLNATRNPRAVVVSPEASAVVGRLRPEYSKVEWVIVDLGFAEWVNAGYPGLTSSV